LKWANNRNYSEFYSERGSVVAEKIEAIEDELLVMLNFFYTVYTGGYEKNKYSKILEPITNLLKKYGDTFDKVIEMIKLTMTIIV